MLEDKLNSSSNLRWIVIFTLSVLSIGTGACRCQILHPQGQTPSFEVATIRSSPTGSARRPLIGPVGGERFFAKNSTVKDLIAFAYTTDSDRQILNLSGWMYSDQYDIEAKLNEAQTSAIAKLPPMQRMDPIRLMVQSLLAERFHLKVHFEVRDLPAFALVQAKGGSKMIPTEMKPSNPPETVKPRLLQMKGAGEAVGVGVTTAMLAELLERQPEIGNGEGRTVVDKTDLSGLYDWTLHWMPWHEQTGQASSEASGPSLFTALQEQLGLKLEPTKTSLEVVVLDSIARPSAN